MSQLTTHVLNTSTGMPAGGIKVVLQTEKDSGNWIELAKGMTDDDGRIIDLLKTEEILDPGIYRLIFHIQEYFDSEEVSSFYPYAIITFRISEEKHYHIPLLLSPFGYTTYRGS